LAHTRSIPIVVVTTADPVRQGLAASLARPGGTVTGSTALTTELLPKLLELAHELIPEARQVSVLSDPRNPGNLRPPDTLVQGLGMTIVMRQASWSDELDAAFAAAATDRDRVMVVQFSAITFEERLRIVALAVRHRLPVVYPLREY